MHLGVPHPLKSYSCFNVTMIMITNRIRNPQKCHSSNNVIQTRVNIWENNDYCENPSRN